MSGASPATEVPARPKGWGVRPHVNFFSRGSAHAISGPSATRANDVMVLLSPSIPPHSIRWQEHAKGRVLEVRLDWHGARATVIAVYQHVWSPVKTAQANRTDGAVVTHHLSRCVTQVPTLLIAGDCNSSVSRLPRLVGPSLLDEPELKNCLRGARPMVAVSTWQVSPAHIFVQGDSRSGPEP